MSWELLRWRDLMVRQTVVTYEPAVSIWKNHCLGASIGVTEMSTEDQISGGVEIMTNKSGDDA